MMVVGVVLITMVGYSTYGYLFSAPTKPADANPEFMGQAQEFSYLVTDNLAFWVNKVVELTGEVSEITDDGILINGTIYCQFENGNDLKSIVENQQINIKGKLVGFDEILMEIKLNQCILP